MPANIAYDAKLSRHMAMYVDKPAWHNLGQVRKEAATAEEAIAEAGTGYTVDKAPAFAQIDGQFVEVPETRFTFRTDLGAVPEAVFAPVAADYPVIQNITPMQMLMEIVRTKEAGIVAHAALGKGERLFAVLDLKRLHDIRIPGDPSTIDGFLVAQWWHDATGALSFGPSAVRTECQNMANAQLDYAERRGMLVRIVHRGDTSGAVDQARRVLGYAETTMDRWVDLMSRLADVAIPTPERTWMDGFLEKLVPIPPEMERPLSRTDAREAIASLYRDSATMVGVPHTAYRVFNAVTEYADHYRPLRVKDAQLVPARRFASVVDGPAARLKQEAMSLLRQEFEV